MHATPEMQSHHESAGTVLSDEAFERINSPLFAIKSRDIDRP